MGDINYILGAIRILEPPRQNTSKTGVLITTFRAQFSQSKNKALVKIVCWGKSGDTIQKYYCSQNYLIIQAYVILGEKKDDFSALQKRKKTRLTALKVFFPIIT